MSSRNRGRGNSSQEADEERRLWKEIQERAREVDAQVARSNAVGHEIIDLEKQQAALLDADKDASSSIDEKLEKLYRENVKITEEVKHILEGQSNGMNLLDSVQVLAGLRTASEEVAAQHQVSQTSRTAGGKMSRPKKILQPPRTGASTPAAASTENGDTEVSAAPSPRINLTASRLNAKDGKASRAGSVAATREASVKVEQDGAESVTSSTTDAPSLSTSTNTATTNSATKSSSLAATSIAQLANNRPGTTRLVLRQGEIVFCRHDPKTPKDEKEGEGILCTVTSVIGEGKQRRYEVQDADTSDNPRPPQRASVSQLIQIPGCNKGLGDLGKGKSVLAEYPDTTTFYKAVVTEAWRGVRVGAGEGPGLVRLSFQDDPTVQEVERRFVLTEK
ncbi:hypothetical protein LTR62_006690 [Meristemomyces frigidus]|uniref:SGF29 C-terminal domain-containing protein n=1 Tax=Meristemomyces frigidus TaxID=1508187 RepID=A0AAN7YJE4_9PEZI|nr:hypothetical protein LTR62_006690 [Meristemomyces frigidus]